MCKSGTINIVESDRNPPDVSCGDDTNSHIWRDALALSFVVANIALRHIDCCGEVSLRQTKKSPHFLYVVFLLHNPFRYQY